MILNSAFVIFKRVLETETAMTLSVCWNLRDDYEFVCKIHIEAQFSNCISSQQPALNLNETCIFYFFIFFQ